MRTETTTRNLYQFEELSDDAKEKAREWWTGLLGHDEWWEDVYEDASRIGLKITSFDLGGRRGIEGEFTMSAQSVINEIKANHGPDTETCKTAMRYDGRTVSEDEDGYEVVEEDTIEEFLHDLLEDYLISLDHEWEYLNSDEQVDESIIANEYEFMEDGEIA